MDATTTAMTFEQWVGRLRVLAQERDWPWLVSGDDEPHRPAFAQGISPEDEIEALSALAQWRGCGCGGG